MGVLVVSFKETGVILLEVVLTFQEEGLSTYFEESWVKERERRHSIEKEIEIKESELYKSIRPPPLFYGNNLNALSGKGATSE